MIMDIDDEEPFDNNDEDLKDPILEQNKKYQHNQIKYMIIILFIFLLIIVSIILIIVTSVIKQNKSQNELLNYGEIHCIFRINDIENNISLISPFYMNITEKPKISVIIDDNNKTVMDKYSHKFNIKGNHNITFILHEQDLNMNNIFKDISSLISVIMISENASLDNIDGAFENCINLEYLKIQGFYVDNLKSLKKLLYNTKISKIDLSEFDTSLIEDFSYMFAGTKIKEFNGPNNNTNNAKNFSYMFL